MKSREWIFFTVFIRFKRQEWYCWGSRYLEKDKSAEVDDFLETWNWTLDYDERQVTFCSETWNLLQQVELLKSRNSYWDHPHWWYVVDNNLSRLINPFVRTTTQSGSQMLFVKICCTPLWESYFCISKKLHYLCNEKSVLDMPVPGSFWNISHEIWGQEGTDHVKPCGSN